MVPYSRDKRAVKCMDGYQTNGHAVYDIKYHMMWVTKYRYGVLKGRIGRRTRELMRQGCQARRITILQGRVGKDHVHILVSCPTSLAPGKIIQYLKGRTSQLLQEQFTELQKRYWGQHLRASGYFCAAIVYCPPGN